jgi:prophage regulatory protein
MSDHIRRPAVITKLGVSKSTLYNLEKFGGFPKPVMITPRLAVWSKAKIEQWLEERAIGGGKA